MLIRSAFRRPTPGSYEAILQSTRRSTQAVFTLSLTSGVVVAELAELASRLQATTSTGELDPKIPRPPPERIAAMAELASRAERLQEEARRLRKDAVRELAGLEAFIDVGKRGIYEAAE
jgi:hypothetical protein